MRFPPRFQVRRLSPVDVVEAYLGRIEAHEPKLQAFVDIYAEDARLAAAGAEKAIRSGHAVGPLHGIPIALKDLIEIEGKTVTGGCEIWKTRKAARTATLARRLIAHGLIVLGKTHTVEFAMGGWGTNTRMGTPWNPWDPHRKRTPGGSSSGSGVAVAAGLAPWAVGTDTGGSVRLPASWCGITGLKTTVGRVSTYGVLPLSPTLDTPGPMTRSVEDAAQLYAAMQGSDPLDPRTERVPYTDPLPGLRRGLRGLRLARMPESERSFASAEVLAAYDSSLVELERPGIGLVWKCMARIEPAPVTCTGNPRWRPIVLRRSRRQSPRAVSCSAASGVYTDDIAATPAMVKTLLLKVPACAQASARRGSKRDMISRRPPNAPKLMPPPMYFPSVVISGTTPSFAWRPPAEMRDVITSSKISTIPCRVARSRSASKNEWSAGIPPPPPIMGSMSMAASAFAF